MQLFRLSLLFLLFAPFSALAADPDGQAKYEASALGISPSNVPEQTPEQKKTAALKWPTTKGALINFVWHGGPADVAGLDTLDIITAVNGKKVVNVDEMRDAVTSAGLKEISVAYYHPTEVKTGITWKPRGTKIKTVTLRSLLETQIERKVDEATGIATYRHKDNTPVVNDKSAIDAFVLDDGKGKAQFNLRLCYVADEWLFIDSFIFVNPLDRITLDVRRHSDVNRDNAAGKIWEWYVASCEVGDENAPVSKIAKALALGGPMKVFYVGTHYRKDREVGVDEQARIMMLLEYIESHPLLKK